jgi:murein DD-endopeptidase MepM/ murein hydrolase activator NlpD
VSFRGQKGGYGNVLEIGHPGQVVTRYGHLSRFATNLKAGDHVDQGEVIGYVGMTGLATGPHLHFEYVVRGESRNPQTAVKTAEATSIDASLRADFTQKAAPLLAGLVAAPAPPATVSPTAQPAASRAVAAR